MKIWALSLAAAAITMCSVSALARPTLEPQIEVNPRLEEDAERAKLAVIDQQRLLDAVQTDIFRIYRQDSWNVKTVSTEARRLIDRYGQIFTVPPATRPALIRGLQSFQQASLKRLVSLLDAQMTAVNSVKCANFDAMKGNHQLFAEQTKTSTTPTGQRAAILAEMDRLEADPEILEDATSCRHQ